MKTEIPAHTEVTCDRCEKVLPKDAHFVSLKIEHTPGGRMSPEDETLDLCQPCCSDVLRVLRATPDRPNVA